MLEKYKSMCRIRDLGLPTVEFKAWSHPDLLENLREAESWSDYLLEKNGMYGVRTEPLYESYGMGNFPHGFPTTSFIQALTFSSEVEGEYGPMYYIFNEGIDPNRLVFNAVAYLKDVFGYWKLAGEANRKDKATLRDAMKISASLENLEDLYGEEFARIRRMLKDSKLYGGEMIEFSWFENPDRIIVWEIRYPKIRKMSV